MCVTIRNLSEDDLPHIMALEGEAWPPDTKATRDQLRDRLESFPDGFFGAFGEDRLVGMASSQIIEFSPSGRLATWTALTASGWISQTHRPQGNCLHFVSVCTDPQARHTGIATALNRARLSLARRLNLPYALTDTRLPGLSRYLQERPGTLAQEYVREIIAGTTSEPVVNMYLTLGFRPLGLIPDCMKSDLESGQYGLGMLRDIEANRP